MTTPINTINDSSCLYGSFEIVDSTNSTTYETNDFKLDPVITKMVRMSAKGLADGKVVLKTGEINGSFTAEYPTATAVAPAFGDAFSVTADGITYACTIEDVGVARSMSGLGKIPVKFSVNLGTVVTSSVTPV